MQKGEELIDQDLSGSKSEQKNQKSRKLPYDSHIFWTGLIGMILCMVPGGIIGLLFVKMSLDRSKVVLKLHIDNPTLYSETSLNKIEKGVLFSKIGIALFVVGLIGLVLIMS